MKLHYSQTVSPWEPLNSCFTTLWNYTTLKPDIKCLTPLFSFTTLWNYTTLKRMPSVIISRPCFTTLWNYTTLKQAACLTYIKVVLLPYEITLLSNNRYFHLPNPLFYYLMKLHYSQTLGTSLRAWFSLTTLWNYTTLKQAAVRSYRFCGFTTLWNYTTLKLVHSHGARVVRFTTLWNYTTLKPQMRISCDTTIHRVTS